MRFFLVIWFVSYWITRLVLPRCHDLACKWNIVDKPNARKVHEKVTPLMGGAAIVLGAILSTLLMVGTSLPNYVSGTIISGTLVAWVGLLDDKKALSAKVRLFVQFIAFAILVWFGVQIRIGYFPNAINIVLTFLWMVGLTNAVNLLDNMDGLSAGIAGIASGFIALMAVLSGQFLVAGVASALAGSCLGFLKWNFPPARIFMGDSGAYFLGFWLSVLSIQLQFPRTLSHVSWMVPIFILGIPLFDTTLVFASRVLRGIHPFTAGKDHVSHRLTLLGFSKREAVLILYLAAFILGTVGTFITQCSPNEAYAVCAIYLLACCYYFVTLERVFHKASVGEEPTATELAPDS